MLEIQDYTGYIKCGEILKSTLPNYQHPFILKCFQCHEINFILESFVIHIQEHCKQVPAQRENVHITTANDDESENENGENSLIKVETVVMEVVSKYLNYNWKNKFILKHKLSRFCFLWYLM